MRLSIPDVVVRVLAPMLVERVAREGEVKAEFSLSPDVSLEVTASAGPKDDRFAGAEPVTA